MERRAEVEEETWLWRELQELGVLGSAETWSGSLRGFPLRSPASPQLSEESIKASIDLQKSQSSVIQNLQSGRL